jgi:hypothetical protein
VKPPRSVKVGATPYSVRYSSRLSDNGEVGSTTFISQSIELLPGQGPDYERDTLLHEVLHAVVFNTNLRSMEGWREDGREEAIVQALAPVLLQVLRENPRLIDYLLEKP